MAGFLTQLKDVLTGSGGEFYDRLDELADHAVSCAKRLASLAGTIPEESPECRRIHEEEEAADAVNHEVTEQLVGALRPPIDASDVHALAEAIDDVVDAIDESAKKFCLYHVRTIRPEFVEQSRVLAESSEILRRAVRTLRRSRWLEDLRPDLDSINALEHRGDEICEAALARLFEPGTEPLVVLRWKELFEIAEHAIDCCHRAGHIIQRVSLHNEG